MIPLVSTDHGVSVRVRGRVRVPLVSTDHGARGRVSIPLVRTDHGVRVRIILVSTDHGAAGLFLSLTSLPDAEYSWDAKRHIVQRTKETTDQYDVAAVSAEPVRSIRGQKEDMVGSVVLGLGTSPGSGHPEYALSISPGGGFIIGSNNATQHSSTVGSEFMVAVTNGEVVAFYKKEQVKNWGAVPTDANGQALPLYGMVLPLEKGTRLGSVSFNTIGMDGSPGCQLLLLHSQA